MPMIDVYATAGTFPDRHRLAADLAGTTLDGASDLRRAPSPPPPHLTEPWFCCAQPTRRQLGAV